MPVLKRRSSGAFSRSSTKRTEAGNAGVDISTEDQNQFRQQVERLITQQPDAVAQLLRNWLSESRRCSMARVGVR